MRALPQIDIQPAPVQADAPVRAHNRESGNFAETLQRSSDAKSSKSAKSSSTEHDSERPRDVAEKVDQPEKTTSEKPAEAEKAPPKKAPTDDHDLPSDDALPVNDEVAVAPEIAALLAVPQTPVIAQSDAAAATLSDFDLLAAGAKPADDNAALTALITTPNATPVVGPAASATAVPFITATTAPQNTDAKATAAQNLMPQAANAALAAAPATDAAPTADVTLVASSTPAVPVATPPTNTKAGDAALPVIAANTSATTDVDPASALPPVVAGDNAAPTNLPPSAAAPIAVPADDAALTTPLPSAAPITTATPATQSTGMHAVAAAIGEHDSKSAAADSSTAPVKATTELATPAAPQQPSTPVTPTRPMSETVLAQNTLATQGNAMEKAVSHQVSKSLVQHLPNGDRMMVLRLTPPELGTVKIEVIERQGVLSARLHAEDDGVRLALERFLPSMRQDLRASDAPIRELTLSDQTQFQRSFADGQQGQQQQDANRPGNRRQRDDAPRFSIDGVRSEPVLVPRAAPLGGRVNLSGVDALA